MKRPVEIPGVIEIERQGARNESQGPQMARPRRLQWVENGH